MFDRFTSESKVWAPVSMSDLRSTRNGKSLVVNLHYVNCAFSALTLLVEQQKGHLASK